MFSGVFIFFALYARLCTIRGYVEVWNWTGNDYIGARALYTTRGVWDANADPGGRYRHISHVVDGIVYLIGDGWRNRSDLWAYNTTTQMWAWLKGSSVELSEDFGIYGPLHVLGKDFMPGQRIDPSSTLIGKNIYVYGGQGRGEWPYQGYLGDIWVFNTETIQWMIIFNPGNQTSGIYGIRGKYSDAYSPRARKKAAMVNDGEVFYIYAGDVSINRLDRSYLCDLWGYNVSLGLWAWLAGTSQIRDNGRYGEKRVKSSTMYPIGRVETHMAYFDGIVYIYGGSSFTGSSLIISDFWQYFVEENVWVWLNGYTSSRLSNRKFKERHVFHEDNFPGNRHQGSTVIYKSWWLLFGGSGENSMDSGLFNNIWAFSFTKQMWAWSMGSSKPRQIGKYSGLSQYPGSRSYSEFMIENNRAYIFGGVGMASSTGVAVLSDLWSVWLWSCESGEGMELHESFMCFKCDRSEYSDGLNCVACTPGKYVNVSGQSSCAACEPGFTSAIGSSVCTRCSPGRYSERGICVDCQEGTMFPGFGASRCFKCPEGHESTRNKTSCTACVQGTYFSGFQCSNCTRGKFSNKSSTTFCESCLLGYGSHEGATLCSMCPAGTFELLGNCSKCKENTYSRKSGVTTCTACDPFTWTTHKAATSCETCWSMNMTSSSKAGYTIPIDIKSRASCSCSPGYYGTPFSENTPNDCRKCKDFKYIICAANSSLPFITEGYYRSPLDPSIGIRCSPPESCLASDTLLTQCSEGYTGKYCARCMHRYYRKGNSCVKCSLLSYLNFVGFFFLALAVLFVILRNSVPTNTKIHAIVISVFWLQLIDVVISSVDNWPPLVNWLFSLISSLNLNIELISPECSFQVDYWSLWHVKMTSTLLLGAMQLYFFVIQEWNLSKFSIFDMEYSKILSLFCLKTALYAEDQNPIASPVRRPKLQMHFPQSKTDEIDKDLDDDFPYRYSRFVYAFGNLFNSLYVLIAVTSLEMLQCVRQSDGSFLLSKFIGQECFVTYWKQMLFSNIIFSVCLLLGFPFWLWRVLTVRRDEFSPENFTKHFGPFVVFYTETAYLWPVVEILFRLLFVVSAQLITFYFPVIGRMCSIGLICLYNVAMYRTKPFTTSLSMKVSYSYVND